MDFLDKITVNKRIEIEELKIKLPLEDIIKKLPEKRDYHFRQAISDKNKINIIAELKKGSPSKGVINPVFDPVTLAQQYLKGGAAAISVLTEQKYFYGQFEYLKVVKDETSLPVLCKDFILDPYQVYHAKLMHADAVLLIVRILNPAMLEELIKLASDVGLSTLVEVHNQKEIETALECGAEIIGVNNRNLDDFTVDIKRAEKLSMLIPDTVIKVAESGIFAYNDIEYLNNAGYNNFLIGEALVKSNDPVKLLKSLRNK